MTVAAAASAPSFLAAQQTGSASPRVSERAGKLYRSALVLDCNTRPGHLGEDDRLPLPQYDLDIVRDCGIDVVKWTIGGLNADFAETVKEIAYIHQMIEVHPAYFTQVRVPDDMYRAKREHKMGIIFSFESVDMLEGKLERFELFRNLGVRVMQLSYNRRSPFAAGVMEPDGGGLTPLGQQAVKSMNNLGIAIDLSHANARTTVDTLALSSKPVVMTHAGCAAIHPHPRNKTDDQLRAIADKGGVVGIFDLAYLAASPKQPTLDDYMAHMEHALKIAGEDHVGVGSDVPVDPFDASAKVMTEFEKMLETRRKAGLAAPEEDRPPYVVGLNFPRRLERIADQLLSQGYSSAVAEKVIGANFARAFKEIWTT
jgi:membrane dipeptidase